MPRVICSNPLLILQYLLVIEQQIPENKSNQYNSYTHTCSTCINSWLSDKISKYEYNRCQNIPFTIEDIFWRSFADEMVFTAKPVALVLSYEAGIMAGVCSAPVVHNCIQGVPATPALSIQTVLTCKLLSLSNNYILSC